MILINYTFYYSLKLVRNTQSFLYEQVRMRAMQKKTIFCRKSRKLLIGIHLSKPVKNDAIQLYRTT